MIPKWCSEDTFLTTSNTAGETKTIPVPQGAGVVIDTAALHYNRTDRHLYSLHVLTIDNLCSSLLGGSILLQAFSISRGLAS